MPFIVKEPLFEVAIGKEGSVQPSLPRALQQVDCEAVDLARARSPAAEAPGAVARTAKVATFESRMNFMIFV
jgi:hypothetical protein